MFEINYLDVTKTNNNSPVPKFEGFKTTDERNS